MDIIPSAPVYKNDLSDLLLWDKKSYFFILEDNIRNEIFILRSEKNHLNILNIIDKFLKLNITPKNHYSFFSDLSKIKFFLSDIEFNEINEINKNDIIEDCKLLNLEDDLIKRIDKYFEKKKFDKIFSEELKVQNIDFYYFYNGLMEKKIDLKIISKWFPIYNYLLTNYNFTLIENVKIYNFRKNNQNFYNNILEDFKTIYFISANKKIKYIFGDIYEYIKLLDEFFIR